VPRRRIETMDIRGIIRYIRKGQSDRATARALGVDRKTVAHYRTWAQEQGFLKGELPSPGRTSCPPGRNDAL